jgi:putative sterol carrier protein
LGYVYLTSLGGEEGWEAKFTADWAKNLVASKVDSFSSEFVMGKAFSNLSSLIYKEIAAEQAFLSKYLKIDLETVKSYGFGQLIQSFNKILGYESSFNTYIQNIKNMAAEGKDGKVSRIYKLVNEDFPKALADAVQSIIGTNYETLKSFMEGNGDLDR